MVLGTGLGLFAPIFAVYLTEQINTDNALEVIGVGTAIYLFTRSLGQIPSAYIIDKIKGEADDWKLLFFGRRNHYWRPHNTASVQIYQIVFSDTWK